VGFDPYPPAGIAISKIYERTKLNNEQLRLTTAPGKGCILEIKIPSDMQLAVVSLLPI
jgi:hypothetical protein